MNFSGIDLRPGRRIGTMWKNTGYVLSIFSLGLAAILFAREGESSNRPADGNHRLAPEWELFDLDGRAVSSEQFKGKVVILDFWATWCPPCRAEIPGFIELQRNYADKGLMIIGISLDRAEPAVVKEFAERFGMNYPVLRGTGKVTEAFGGVNALPTTFIIDRQGRIVDSHVGYTAKEEFERAIRPLL